jgi:hypothetical protein
VAYGAAYLFDSETGDVVYTFTHDSPSIGDRFGWALAIISDTLIVGVPEHNFPSPNAGRVYLCGLTTGLCPEAINNPSLSVAGNFGRAVAAVGGYIAVGAPLDSGHGTVFIYEFDGVTATPAYTIAETASSTGDEFGWALTALGDRILIGAPADDFGANNAGAAYLYELDGTPVYTFTNPVPHENDRFGASLATDGNLILIAAPDDDAGTTDAGAVHVFSATTFEFLRTVQAPAPTPAGQFGFSLSPTAGGEFLAGAFDTVTATGAGAVHRIGIQTEWRLYLPVVMK